LPNESDILKSPRNGSEDDGEREGIVGEPCDENDDRNFDSESEDHKSIGEVELVSDFEDCDEAPGEPALEDAEDDGCILTRIFPLSAEEVSKEISRPFKSPSSVVSKSANSSFFGSDGSGENLERSSESMFIIEE